MTTYELAEKLLKGPNVAFVMECPITYELVEVSGLCESNLNYRDELSNGPVEGITIRATCFEPSEDELEDNELDDDENYLDTNFDSTNAP